MVVSQDTTFMGGSRGMLLSCSWVAPSKVGVHLYVMVGINSGVRSDSSHTPVSIVCFSSNGVILVVLIPRVEAVGLWQ